MRLLLASRSPRRRSLLEEAGLAPLLVPPGAEDEAAVPAEFGPEQRAIHLARGKALGARPARESGLLLASDTVVALGSRVYGKPETAAEARSFLEDLEGRSHEVWTAIVLVPVERGVLAKDRIHAECDRAEVRFRRFLDGEIDAYLAAGEWSDKAGGYGIQGRAAAFATVAAGERDTVIGLPTRRVLSLWERYQSGSWA